MAFDGDVSDAGVRRSWWRTATAAPAEITLPTNQAHADPSIPYHMTQSAAGTRIDTAKIVESMMFCRWLCRTLVAATTTEKSAHGSTAAPMITMRSVLFA